uniref:Uncharacterized protein n=1 Tax=Panagrellus redivivus TaxID=6233 RepID=A0A7E4V1L8_PANRE
MAATLMGVSPEDLEALADDTTLTRLLKLEQECQVIKDRALPSWAAILLVVFVHLLTLLGMAALLIRSHFKMKGIEAASMFPTPSQVQLTPSAYQILSKKSLGKKPIDAIDLKPAGGSEANVSMTTKDPTEHSTPPNTTIKTPLLPTTTTKTPTTTVTKTSHTNITKTNLITAESLIPK